jgi:F-type H+-transporting ATPase subunit alpha
MEMEDQVIGIYIANQGLLDKVPVNKIQDWEVSFLRYIKQNHGDVVKEIATTGKLEVGAKAKIEQAVTEHLKTFNV